MAAAARWVILVLVLMLNACVDVDGSGKDLAKVIWLFVQYI